MEASIFRVYILGDSVGIASTGIMTRTVVLGSSRCRRRARCGYRIIAAAGAPATYRLLILISARDASVIPSLTGRASGDNSILLLLDRWAGSRLRARREEWCDRAFGGGIVSFLIWVLGWTWFVKLLFFRLCRWQRRTFCISGWL